MSDLQVCPNCGTQTQTLIPVDAGMRLRMQEVGNTDIPSHVCSACQGDVAQSLSQGAMLIAKQKARQQQIKTMWDKRIQLIRQGRIYMQQKMFAEAAVSYEKYIRVLEIAFTLEPGQLTPDLFKDPAHKKEITLISGVYWDLFRIYDTNPRHLERMQVSAKKLAEFVRYSPVFPDIIKRAQNFKRTAKNPQVVGQFLKLVNADRARCFIATAAFQDPTAEPVLFFRAIRDAYLRKTSVGRRLIAIYYFVSPWLSQKLDHSPILRVLLRSALTLVYQVLACFPILSQIELNDRQLKSRKISKQKI